MVEIKLFIVASLLSLTSGGDLQGFLGEWSPAMVFFNSSTTMFCKRLYIDLDPSTCVCDGTSTAMVTARGYEPLPTNLALKYPTLVADTPGDVPIALSKTCECDGRDYPLIVFRRINDNCVVQYEIHDGRKYTEKEPNDAMLLVRTAPKSVKELEELCKVEDLKDRTGYLACPTMFS